VLTLRPPTGSVEKQNDLPRRGTISWAVCEGADLCLAAFADIHESQYYYNRRGYYVYTNTTSKTYQACVASDRYPIQRFSETPGTRPLLEGPQNRNTHWKNEVIEREVYFDRLRPQYFGSWPVANLREVYLWK
jgi:hypothetical protein